MSTDNISTSSSDMGEFQMSTSEPHRIQCTFTHQLSQAKFIEWLLRSMISDMWWRGTRRKQNIEVSNSIAV